MHGFKSDPPALRTGNDKFRISFSHVQRSLSNRKPAEREREEKKKKKKTTRTVFSWAHSLQDVQLQVSYGCLFPFRMATVLPLRTAWIVDILSQASKRDVRPQ